MSSIIHVFDKEGKFIGKGTHSMRCMFYVEEIGKQYLQNFNIGRNFELVNLDLKIINKVISREDDLIFQIFFDDDCILSEEDIPNINKAILKLKDDNPIHENIKNHLNAYLKVINEYKYITLKYIASYGALAIHTN